MRSHRALALFLSIALLAAFGCSDDDDSPTAITPESYRIAYVYGYHAVNSNSFELFLEDHGYDVDQVHIDDVPLTGLDGYDLIIAGHTIPAAIDQDEAVSIKTSYRPVLAMGAGGAYLFEAMGLSINWGNSWVDADTSSTTVSSTEIYVMDPANMIFNEPIDVNIAPTELVTLYDHSGHVAVYGPNAELGVEFLGREPDNATHYSLCSEYGKFFLWGFFNGPHAMTEAGKDLYLNVVHHLTRFDG